MESKDEYIERMRRHLDERDAEISELEANLDDYKDVDQRTQYEKLVAVLKIKRDEASEKLDEVKRASDDTWESIKDKAENVWDAMKDSFDRFKSHFK